MAGHSFRTVGVDELRVLLGIMEIVLLALALLLPIPFFCCSMGRLENASNEAQIMLTGLESQLGTNHEATMSALYLAGARLKPRLTFFAKVLLKTLVQFFHNALHLP